MLPGEGPRLAAVKPGDKLAVQGGYNRDAPSRIVTVTKIMKLYVECSDGSKWDFRGYQRPRGNGYHTVYAEPLTDAHVQAMRRERLLIDIQNWAEGLRRERGKGVTTETLEAVAAAIGVGR